MECSENGELVLMEIVQRNGMSDERFVEERGKERYCWRAGVMSRDEGEEEEGLFVWTVFLYLNAYFLSRLTVVREGMSVCEDRVMRSTLQSDDSRTAECRTVISFSSECCEFRQVY